MRLILLVALFLASPIAFTAPIAFAAQTCTSRNVQGYNIRWCLEPGSADSHHVVYYFHGIGGNEEHWQRTRLHETLNENLLRSPELRPHIFSVSFGRAWFFTDYKNRQGASRLSAFRSLMPELEATLPGPLTRRTSVGESMGGYNALRLVMDAPELFQQVVSLCPALLPVGPYSSSAEIEAFKERNRGHLDVKRLETLRYWAMWEFPNQAAWTSNNPLDRSALPVPAFPPVYLSQYLKDEYGFAEGTELFSARMTIQGHASTLRTVDAGHCRHTPEILQEASANILGE